MKRREFIKRAASAKKPLRVAVIGCGDRGARQLLPECCKEELDAVVIATPNHQHAPSALMAMRRGIHVYVEKPLTHKIAELRLLMDEAKRTGAIGQVYEIHCWTSRCDGLFDGHHSPALPLPEGFDWDAWIGPGPFRNYHADLHPHGWHLWHDFDNGSVGNMACHLIDPSYWALKLNAPEAVEVEDMYGGIDGVWPIRTRIRWYFPSREGMAPVKVYFYDGLAEGQEYSEKTVGKRLRASNAGSSGTARRCAARICRN